MGPGEEPGARGRPHGPRQDRDRQAGRGAAQDGDGGVLRQGARRVLRHVAGVGQEVGDCDCCFLYCFHTVIRQYSARDIPYEQKETDSRRKLSSIWFIR